MMSWERMPRRTSMKTNGQANGQVNRLAILVAPQMRQRLAAR